MEQVDNVTAMFPYSTELGMNEVKSIDTLLLCKKEPDGLFDFTFPFQNIEMSAGNQIWHVSSYKSNPYTYVIKVDLDLKTSSTNWRVKAHISVFLRNKTDNSRCVDKIYRDKLFKYNSRSASFDVHFPDFEKVMSDWISGEKTRTEQVQVEIQICVVQITGFRNRARITYDFATRTEDANLKLVFADEQVVYVDVGYLSHLSGYFASLRRRLEDLPKDASSDLPFETLDVDYEEFVTLLLVVYPSKKRIDESNVSFLLVLADRFLFEGLMADIERYLMSHEADAFDIFSKLDVSCTYRMADLQDHALSELPTRASIMLVKESSVYSNLSVDVMTCLFERLIDKAVP